MSQSQIIPKIQSLQENPTLAQTMDLQQLEQIIRDARTQYYEPLDASNPNPWFTDAVYDQLEAILQQRHPSSQCFQEIGTNVFTKQTAVLPYWMGSLDKIYPTEEAKLRRWLQKNKQSSSFTISAKLDGCSAIFENQHGTWKLYSRGNGQEGTIWNVNLSYLNPHIHALLTSKLYAIIRGEFVMSKQNFQSCGTNYKTSLAMVNGLMNSKTKDPALLYQVDFIAYEFIPTTKQTPYITDLTTQWTLLQQHGFTVPVHKCIPTNEVTMETFSTCYTEWKQQYPYPMDGIVISNNFIVERYVSGNPSYAFAYKQSLEEQKAETTVVEVEWNVSKDGYLKPIAHIDPVCINGTTISKCTLINAKFVMDHCIGIGSRVVVEKCGGVIPNITSVLSCSTTGEPNFPNEMEYEYSWTENHVDLQTFEETPQYKAKNIAKFFEILEVTGFSEGRVMKLVEHNITTLEAILQLQLHDLVGIEGIGDKIAHHLLTEIKRICEHAEMEKDKWMIGSNLFGRGFAKKKIDLILKYIPNVIERTDYERLAQDINQLNGFNIKTTDRFIVGLQKFQLLWNHLKELGIISISSTSSLPMQPSSSSTNPTTTTTTELADCYVVLTGFRDKSLTDWIETHGGHLQSSLNKKTKYLIVKDMDYTNSKTEQAIQLKIPIVTAQQFMTLHNL